MAQGHILPLAQWVASSKTTVAYAVQKRRQFRHREQHPYQGVRC